MALFTNQATLVYNGGSAVSNVAVGELLEVLSADKIAVGSTYAPGELVTYVVTIRNAGTGAFTGLTVTDDLGGFTNGTGTVYPLTYEEGSILFFVNGVPQAAPAVTAGLADGTITNTVTVTGGGLTGPVTASETVTVESGPDLTITKTISPAQVADNGRVTYTFLIQNRGNEAVTATDNAVITDTFDPILTDLVVTYNGTPWTEGVNYTYDRGTGLFTTSPGQITVPAADFTRNPDDSYTATPGTAVLTVTGTI